MRGTQLFSATGWTDNFRVPQGDNFENRYHVSFFLIVPVLNKCAPQTQQVSVHTCLPL